MFLQPQYAYKVTTAAGPNFMNDIAKKIEYG